MSRSSLLSLTDQELLSTLSGLVKKETVSTIEILRLLNEIARRGLYLKLGFSSLHDYCTRQLKYSGSSASRRVRSAQALRRFPEVSLLLESGEMNLSTLSLLSDILTDENHRELLEVRVAVPDGPKRGLNLGEEPQNPCKSLNLHNRCGSSAAPAEGRGLFGHGSQEMTLSKDAPSSPPCVHVETRVHIQFLASEGFMKKFEQARALISNRPGGSSYERVFEAMIDEFIERHSPEKKNERREERRARKASSQEASTTNINESPARNDSTQRANGGGGNAARPAPATALDESTQTDPARAPDENARHAPPRAPKTRRRISVNTPDEGSRHIPAAVRDKVFERDQGRCTYIGANGRRCAETRYLHIDHIVPFARGGMSTLGNMRLLCSAHNRVEAERVYGVEAMRRFRKRE